MYDKKDIYNAIVLFERIPDYKDSQICIDEIKIEIILKKAVRLICIF